LAEITIDKIRNVCISGHAGTGKTTLIENLLFQSKAIDKPGKVDSGNTVTDYDPEEIKRKVTINLAIAPLNWSGMKINVIDTPGYLDFAYDVISAMSVVETAVILIDGSAGIEVGSEKVWEYSEKENLPKLIFINKLNKERADFFTALKSIRETFKDKRIIPIQLPIGKEANFKGVIDLITMKAHIYSEDKVKKEDIPDDLKDLAQQYRSELIEASAEGDDELTMKFLEDTPLTDDEVKKGLVELINHNNIVLVTCGVGMLNIGTADLLDIIVKYFPAPPLKGKKVGKTPDEKEASRKMDSSEPFSASVFKTITDPFTGKINYFRVWSGELHADSTILNSIKGKTERIIHPLSILGKKTANIAKVTAGDIGAIAKLETTLTGDTLCSVDTPIIYELAQKPPSAVMIAIKAKSAADEDKIGMAIHKLLDDDPTLHMYRDAATRETVISGVGDIHIDVVKSRLKNIFHVEVETTTPKVPYRETITAKGEAQHKHKKQSGGRGQYGEVYLRFEPLPNYEGYEFVDDVVGGVVPSKYIPAAEKGIKEALEKGVLAGYPIQGVRVTIYDGSYHSVDSSDMAFKIAGSMCFKKGFLNSSPIILEPIVKVYVQVPDQYMGDIIGDLNSKRGKILKMTQVGTKQEIHAEVPMGEMFNYAADLRSIARGRGSFRTEFSHYERVPYELQEKIVASSKKVEEEEE